MRLKAFIRNDSIFVSSGFQFQSVRLKVVFKVLGRIVPTTFQFQSVRLKGEILEAYEIIEKMEAENRTLKRENIELIIERDQFRSLAEELRGKLAKVSQDFDDCAKQARKYISIQKDEKDQNKRPHS